MIPRAIRSGLPSGLLVTLLSVASLSPSQSTSTTPLGAYGGCAPPSHQGINICQPQAGLTTNAPFQVIAAATSGRGRLVRIELWADGKKVAQVSGTPLSEPVTLDPGSHELTVVEVDDTGAVFKSTPRQVVVNAINGAECTSAGSPGVNVCEPTGACNTSPWINFSAAGTAASGATVQRMELWINGTKVANFPGDHFNTNLILFNVNYTVRINAVDNAGHVLSKSMVLDGPC